MLGAMNSLDRDDARPSYLQLAARLRADISSGTLQPGAQLPTHRGLAEDYGVAIETAKRALGELRNEGLIVSRQGKGSYVRQRTANATDNGGTEVVAQLASLRDELEAVKDRLEALESAWARE